MRAPQVASLPCELDSDELTALSFEPGNARLAVARRHDFADRAARHLHAEAVARGGVIARFESSAAAAEDGCFALDAAAG